MSDLGKEYHIAGVTVRKVQEQYLHDVPPSFLYPSAKAEEIKAIGPRLAGIDMDEDRDTLVVSIHTWLVKTPDHVILIDTGSGNDKERPRNPGFHHQTIPFLDRLRRAGVAPEDVDFVINTHLHVDHSGWNTVLQDGKWVPTFKNARYIFPRVEQEYYSSTASHNDVNIPSSGVYEDSVWPVIDAGIADFIDSEGGTFLDRFTFLPTPGHSIGHMSVLLEADNESAIFAGDVMHHPIQVERPDFNTVFCEFLDLAAQSRRRVLELTADKHAMYFSTHFPGSSAGYVTRDGEKFRWSYV
ncbi:glyoxylase-like metal-dependent hydrolase (beta-lactamase superfamily II) [Rhizobium leguminosarum]|uniref:Glyoxylase-like metal-dependent hydrolase (Beta-lactamase superfamily II) n=1 Tax=Rhizobium leguminosarum TaxID=384 RepID=A0AAE2MGY4_RHILE|nr:MULTISPECIES: MBL fold metallo-hydrolase [Rhizobium]MBB4289248.1 glyoxylase-like metal-dependent hydrolase (beta-lactamase superfamily II) [Rhizobium leguminosarum]MBB4294657.1 glyoxylase-like metal-dependent hydrolase (beta-lactamase superfamily II) [Rhizobium leguminosarum]MBB4306052.1 glyoxylase-like metal-dependent hydrolase (beta-lactamase superfamily II) [Rhizobium leguminosarum]MBB4418370.1 glyoxylase-like metal-dependent hydrolase (beta-lactamase superfamily II) [Rhizobium leguminosa